MSDEQKELLDSIIKQSYQLDKDEEKVLYTTFNKVTKTIIKTAKRLSKQFLELFYSANYPDSYQDGFRVQAFSSEFILNVVFKLPNRKWRLKHLGENALKPNRAVIHIPKRGSSETWNNLLIQDDEGRDLISPQIMARILYDAVDLALDEVKNNISTNKNTYKVTRSEDSPDLLIAEPQLSSAAEGPKLKFSVRLVVGFQLQMKHLKTCPELKQRVEHILTDFSIDSKSFRAIVSEECDLFEISFPDIEREILTLSGCAKDVITTIKLWLLHTGVRMTPLWSRLLQTSLIHRAIEKKSIAGYWDRENLAVCLADCVNTLFLQLQKDYITNVFFPQINMLDRTDRGEVTDFIKWVGSLRNLCETHREIGNKELFGAEDKKTDDGFECQLCGINFNSEDQLEEHKAGIVHLFASQGIGVS